MSDHETKCTCGTYKTAESLCSAHFVAPVTAPRTSPLTEEEARKLMCECGEGPGEHDVACDRRTSVLLRVASEAHDRGAKAALEMQTLCNEAIGAQLLDVQQDCIAEAIKRRAAEADLDEAVRLLRDDVSATYTEVGAWIKRKLAFLADYDARHPTPSTPTTGETEGA